MSDLEGEGEEGVRGVPGLRVAPLYRGLVHLPNGHFVWGHWERGEGRGRKRGGGQVERDRRKRGGGQVERDRRKRGGGQVERDMRKRGDRVRN